MMGKKFVRILSVILATVLVSGLMSSCARSKNATGSSTSSGSNSYFNKTGYPIVNSKIVLKIMYPSTVAGADWNTQTYNKKMEELTGIDFQYTAVPNASWDEKKNLCLASGDLPDVFWSLINTADEAKYGTSGTGFVDQTKLINTYMPNLKKYLDKNPSRADLLKETNGKIYSLPYIAETTTMAADTFYTREDMLKQANITSNPATTDELYNDLVTLKKANPSQNFSPLVPSTAALEGFLFPAFGDAYDPAFGLDKNGKVVFDTISDQYLNYLTYVNKLYNEKLIPQEIFTMTTDQTNAKIKTNQCAIMCSGTQLTTDQFASGKLDVELLAPLTSKYTTTKKIRKYSVLSTGYGVITSANKYPEATARWLDMNYSENEVVPGSGVNRMSVWIGLQGQNWDYTNSDKTAYKRILPAGTTLADAVYFRTYVSPENGPCNLTFPAMPDSTVSSNASLYMKGSQSVKNLYPYMKDSFPDRYLRYTPNETDTITSKWTDINTYVTGMKAKFITGQEPLSNWPQFVATVKSMGINNVIAVKQASYKRMTAK